MCPVSLSISGSRDRAVASMLAVDLSFVGSSGSRLKKIPQVPAEPTHTACTATGSLQINVQLLFLAGLDLPQRGIWPANRKRGRCKRRASRGRVLVLLGFA